MRQYEILYTIKCAQKFAKLLLISNTRLIMQNCNRETGHRFNYFSIIQERRKTHVDCYCVLWYSPGTCFEGLPGPYAPLASFLCWMVPDPGRCNGYQDLGQPIPARMVTSCLRYITKILRIFSLSLSLSSALFTWCHQWFTSSISLDIHIIKWRYTSRTWNRLR